MAIAARFGLGEGASWMSKLVVPNFLLHVCALSLVTTRITASHILGVSS